mgnify:CR=1 FL=1
MMLGVKKVFVIEPEYFDTTNRSRYMGFNYNDIGEAKTNVAVRVVRAIDPECKIYAIQKPLELKPKETGYYTFILKMSTTGPSHIQINKVESVR